jgi:cytochrome c-type biogenesis protein CcmH/NrfG
MLAQTVVIICLALLAAPSHGQPSTTFERVDRVARAIERGDAHRKIGDAVSALAFYRDAITIAPRRFEGYAALGAMYLSLGEPARALEVYENGVRSAAGGEALWLGYATTLEQVGQPERARAALRHFVTLEPSARAALRALAEAAARHGAFVEALGARRALVDQLERATLHRPELRDELTLERAQVRALERILGAAERVRSRERCDEQHAQVARALAHCP